MKSENNIFAENFRECCIRSSAGDYQQRANDPDRLDALEQCSQLYEIIKLKLGEDHVLINDFDAAKNCYCSIELDNTYHRGFQDCIYLLNWIGLL